MHVLSSSMAHPHQHFSITQKHFKGCERQRAGPAAVPDTEGNVDKVWGFSPTWNQIKPLPGSRLQGFWWETIYCPPVIGTQSLLRGTP